MSVATAGAATPIAVMGVLTASAFIGGGISSTTYSIQCAATGDNWNIGEWAANVAIGAVAGIGGAAASGVTGAAVSAASGVFKSFAARSVLTVGAGITAGAIADGTINSLSTLAYNGLTGSPLLEGVGAAAIGGAIGGGIGGLFGSIAGVRGRIQRKYEGILTDRSVAHFRGIPLYDAASERASMASPGGSRHLGGAVGIVHSKTGKIDIGYYNENPHFGAAGPSHAQLAMEIYGNLGYTGVRVSPAGSRLTYPDLKGFTLRKTGMRAADVGFISQTLNGYRPGMADRAADLLPGRERIQILSGLRKAGFNVSIPGIPARFPDLTREEKLILWSLGTPY